jgi:RNA 2',3'-cyclic 3'-phosphodiesterase
VRLFIAVELSDTVIAAAMEAARELQRKVDGRVRASWAQPGNMHLTVRFIGAVEEGRAGAVIEALKPTLPVAEFDLALGSCGAFPSSSRPRVFWIGIARGGDALRAMHHACNQRLAPLGFAPEDRPFSAHLTLARVKETTAGSSALLREAVGSIRPAAAECRVRAATLFRSHLSSKGARYEPLLAIPCAPPTANC